MAQNEIKMSPSEMDTAAGKLDGIKTDMESVLTSFQNMMDGLRESWIGVAAEGYEAQWNELKPAFTQVETIIEGMATELRDTASDYAEDEARRAAKYKVVNS